MTDAIIESQYARWWSSKKIQIIHNGWTMRPWSFPVALDPGQSSPQFLQIARAISADIQRGRLRPGAVLPGSRTLASTLGVHRNTVLAGYQELLAEGWIVSTGRTTRVSSSLPERAPAPRSKRTSLGFELSPSPPPERPATPTRPVVDFGTGLPDLRLIPTEAMSRAYRRAVLGKDRGPLGYGDTRGDPVLREALGALLSEVRGLSCGTEQLVITGGSQMALDLVARTLIRPGDVVAVEDPGYPPSWTTLRLAGAEVVAVPVDEEGMSIDALEALTEARALRAVYVTPHHQFPTTVTMSPARRMRLLALAKTKRIAVLEDDYDFEFHYDGRPVLPLASSDDAGVVVYLGTLSKILAPGIRLGFVAGPAELTRAIGLRRTYLDRQGDQIVERAVAELLDDGTLARHARKMRRLYLGRRDAMADALRERLGDVLSFDVPSGGMSFWASVKSGIDVDAWAQRAAKNDLRLLAGSLFDFRGRNRPHFRLGFSALDEREMREGVRRMWACR